MKLNIRFQHWVLATTTALVLALTAVFLTTVFGKFATLAESKAREQFALIVDKAAGEVTQLVGTSARFVTAQSRGARHFFERDMAVNATDLVPLMLASVEGDPNVYGHYFGLASDDFVQVIGVRGQPGIVAAIGAATDTQFAVRRITREPGAGGGRVEHWQFLDAAGQTLATRTEPATYAPTGRPWFTGARASGRLSITEPYLFASTGEPGLTISAPLTEAIGVFGTDLALNALDHFLASLSLTPNASILILDAAGRVLALHEGGSTGARLGLSPLAILDPSTGPLSASLAALRPDAQASIVPLAANGTRADYVIASRSTEPIAGAYFRVVAIAPLSDFTGTVVRARQEVLFASGLILLVLIPLAMAGSHRVVLALVRLADNSETIKKLDFTTNPVPASSFLYEINTLSDAQIVMHHSIKERTEALHLAQDKLARLVDNGILLASEQDREKLLHHILFGARDLAHCAAATLYLKTDHDTLRFALRTQDDALPDFEVPLHDPASGEPMESYVSSYAGLHNETVVIDDVYRESRFDLSGTRRFSEETGFRTVSILTVPLSPHTGQVIGVLQLMNALDSQTGEAVPFAPEIVRYIEALAAQAAVAIENHNLLEAQKQLMDSLIRILAGAIDAKSPYTGGHCERVPELAFMLAEETEKVQDGPLAAFRFASEEEWREFRIGAWLHDCGKVTTPEYVVDKATKLETIFNRIHEVRTRFEVLLRDARIECLETIAGGTPAAQAESRFEARRAQLTEEFAFIAECNIGGEFLSPDRIERIRSIGAQTWLRHFDDRLGLSHEELRRYENYPPSALPVVEALLADQPWHIVPRTDLRAFDPKYGFQISVPEHLYDFGELHNLCIERGTLSTEERFKINEHIIQTIVMLDNLPFPPHLKRVPEYAGTHHETLIGTGYPRRLTQDELSVPARIMAIADIFEALTASDRPYKKAKTLSESIRILSFFKKDRHIDGDLFDLFLTSGVYLRYAERFLKPEQIDEVDISAYLG